MRGGDLSMSKHTSEHVPPLQGLSTCGWLVHIYSQINPAICMLPGTCTAGPEAMDHVPLRLLVVHALVSLLVG